MLKEIFTCCCQGRIYRWKTVACIKRIGLVYLSGCVKRIWLKSDRNSKVRIRHHHAINVIMRAYRYSDRYMLLIVWVYWKRVVNIINYFIGLNSMLMMYNLWHFNAYISSVLECRNAIFDWLIWNSGFALSLLSFILWLKWMILIFDKTFIFRSWWGPFLMHFSI